MAVPHCHSDVLLVEPEHRPQAIIDWHEYDPSKKDKNGSHLRPKDMTLKAKKHLTALGWVLWYGNKNGKRELRYSSPKGSVYYSLKTACKACIDDDDDDDGGKESSVDFVEKFSRKRTVMDCGPTMKVKKPRRGKASKSLIKFRDRLGGGCRPKSRLKRDSGPVTENPRSILSWLIDNNVVVSGGKVCCGGRINGCPGILEGWVSSNGIKCSCCWRFFSLSGFQAHATGTGRTYGRPAADNVCLEDGRSLLDCQIQLVKRLMKERKHGVLTGNWKQGENDEICLVCHYGGDLMLCDGCPSSFHRSCLGLKDTPDGDWFCPTCCCGICDEAAKSCQEIQDSVSDGILRCEQCETRYHFSCLRSAGKLGSCQPGKLWFCSSKCRTVFFGLQDLVGKAILVGDNGLTWRLLKFKDYHDSLDDDVPDIAALAEIYIKLNTALDVMHECFEPVKEAFTGRDLVEDLVFSRGSELNRMNFRGFYNVILEGNDELISVANLRVYGVVAEMPLVATRFQFRRLGMCRILMEEVEKKPRKLGVEKLILPAIPSMLNTWKTSFGFSEMTSGERLDYLNYNFLDFQDTIMCQKYLMLELPQAL